MVASGTLRNSVRRCPNPGVQDQFSSRPHEPIRHSLAGVLRAQGVLLSGFLIVTIACTATPPDQAAGPGATGDDVASGEYPVVTYPDQGREHLTTGSPAPAYNSDPPTSGPHAPNSVPCGIHVDPVPDVVAVHNLEHGVVVIHYLPTIPREDISELVDAVAGFESHFVVAPRPNNPAPITLSAWTVQLRLDEVDVAAVRWFWDEYSGQGPEILDCPIEVG
jgi:hypothetical protein